MLPTVQGSLARSLLHYEPSKSLDVIQCCLNFRCRKTEAQKEKHQNHETGEGISEIFQHQPLGFKRPIYCIFLKISSVECGVLHSNILFKHEECLY